MSQWITDAEQITLIKIYSSLTETLKEFNTTFNKVPGTKKEQRIRKALILAQTEITGFILNG
jgi:hypothetical protein